MASPAHSRAATVWVEELRRHPMPANCAVRGSFFDFVDDPWKHPGHFLADV
jgi:hypothetical protein